MIACWEALQTTLPVCGGDSRVESRQSIYLTNGPTNSARQRNSTAIHSGGFRALNPLASVSMRAIRTRIVVTDSMGLFYTPSVQLAPDRDHGMPHRPACGMPEPFHEFFDWVAGSY